MHTQEVVSRGVDKGEVTAENDVLRPHRAAGGAKLVPLRLQHPGSLPDGQLLRQGTEQAEGMELGLVFAADRPGRGKGQSGLLRQAHRQSGPLLGGELPEQLRL